jgi:hypothetical protein
MEDTACPYKEGNLVLMESMWGVEKYLVYGVYGWVGWNDIGVLDYDWKLCLIPIESDDPYWFTRRVYVTNQELRVYRITLTVIEEKYVEPRGYEDGGDHQEEKYRGVSAVNCTRYANGKLYGVRGCRVSRRKGIEPEELQEGTKGEGHITPVPVDRNLEAE